MKNLRIITSRKYTVKLGNHVFHSDKFFKTARMLVKEGIIKEKDILEPSLPSINDLLLVHTAQWADKIINRRLTPEDISRSQIPCSKKIMEAHLLAAGGTIKACETALKYGACFHAGGGAHHAFAGHGEGFCLLNDIAIGIRKQQKTGGIKRAVVIDLDAHQGNGTASIFRNSHEVFTFSMHQKDIYPEKKEKSSLDIELKKGTGGGEYLALLLKHLPEILNAHKPGLAVYAAGADCYEHDLLGGLKLTFDELKKRDETVFSECRKRSIPIAVVLAGGYALNPGDTIRIHAQTFKSLHKLYNMRGWKTVNGRW